MQKGLLVAALLSLAVYVVAEENEDAPASAFAAEQPSESAPQEVVNTAKDACEVWAVADEIPDPELDAYMRDCVDSELEYHGYRPLTARSRRD